MDIDFYNQKKHINFLKQSFKLNRLAHSYIFSGPEGLGKLEIARFFINIIQCLNLNDNSEPCGECKNCIKIKQNIFVDNLEVTTAGDKTTISVDQIREEILEFARYSSNEGKYKVCLIYPAEKMRAEAMNALLKILEEPPEKFVFILITSNHFQLLPTILSRCQILKFNPLPVKQIETRLIKYKNFEPVKARILSVLSGGRINFAIKLEESGALEKRQNILNGLSAALEKKSFFEYFNLGNFLVSEMKKGYSNMNLVAKIAGGASMFEFNLNGAENGIGEQNVLAVKRTLESLGIPIVASHTGGNSGRTMIVNLEDFKVTIRCANSEIIII